MAVAGVAVERATVTGLGGVCAVAGVAVASLAVAVAGVAVAGVAVAGVAVARPRPNLIPPPD